MKHNYFRIETKFLHEKGVMLLVLVSEKTIDVVELSHRGEVRGISEFCLNEKDWLDKQDEISNVFIDKNGQVYLFRHQITSDECQDKSDKSTFHFSHILRADRSVKWTKGKPTHSARSKPKTLDSQAAYRATQQGQTQAKIAGKGRSTPDEKDNSQSASLSVKDSIMYFRFVYSADQKHKKLAN